MRSPSRCASSRRFKTRATAPSQAQDRPGAEPRICCLAMTARTSPAKSTAPTIDRVELACSQPVSRDRQRLDARRLITRHREARSTDLEFARDPAGDQPAERSHGSVRGQWRPGRAGQIVDPSSELIRRKASPSSSFQARARSGHRPAEIIIGRIRVQPDADQDARPKRSPRIPASVADRLGGDPQHQRLLRLHLRELPGRDAKLVDAELERVDVVTGERSGIPALAPRKRRIGNAPRVSRPARGRLLIDSPATDFPGGRMPVKRPKMSRQARRSRAALRLAARRSNRPELRSLFVRASCGSTRSILQSTHGN